MPGKIFGFWSGAADGASFLQEHAPAQMGFELTSGEEQVSRGALVACAATLHAGLIFGRLPSLASASPPPRCHHHGMHGTHVVASQRVGVGQAAGLAARERPVRVAHLAGNEALLRRASKTKQSTGRTGIGRE
jgi:hypothetical protein